MAIFKLEKNKLISIEEIKIDLEKDLQKVTEENLQAVFGLKFICSEFALQNLRIDTLAFNTETNSFVIIEYKRDRSFSIVDQGFSYLSLMLNHKADFILEYNEKLEKNLRREDVDWSQSTVLFLANSFTPHQINAINFKDLPIELWKVKKFNNGTILYNQVESSNTTESINKISKNKIIENVSREVKKRTVEDHFKPDWEQSRELFEIVREKLLSLDDRIEENPNPKPYIGYKIGNSNLVAVHTYRSKIVVCISRTHPNDLKDPEKKATLRLNSMRHYNQHLTDIDIKSEKDIDYMMFLVKQAYDKFI
jgi:predicted transport protein